MDEVNRKVPSRAPRTRLDPRRREQEIVEGAVLYFSEVGFDGSMRDLAQRLGISHALLFRYFPTKDALIDRVYEEIYVGRWDESWDSLLEDSSVSFRERLERFYTAYVGVIDRPEWVRTFLFGGLAGVNINQRYLKIIQRKVIAPVASELVALSGVKGAQDGALAKAAMELSWGLHGEIFYLAIRRRVYGVKVAHDLPAFVSMTVAKFLEGAPAALRSEAKRKA